MAWWSRKKKMKVDNIEVQTTNPRYKIEPISEDTYRVHEKGPFEWRYRTTFDTFEKAEQFVKKQIDLDRQYEEKLKGDKEFQAKNPTRYYS